MLGGEVRFDDGSRALYATDGSNYRQPPIGVVIPKDVDDIVHAVAVCRRHRAPILGRGGGTGLAGQCCNTAVVFVVARMDVIDDYDITELKLAKKASEQYAKARELHKQLDRYAYGGPRVRFSTRRSTRRAPPA